MKHLGLACFCLLGCFCLSLFNINSAIAQKISLHDEEQARLAQNLRDGKPAVITKAEVLQCFLIASVFFCCLIFLFIFWNRKLVRLVQETTTELKHEIDNNKLTNLSLAKSEKKYCDLVDNAMVGVFNAQIDEKFTFVNSAMARMYDFDTPEQMQSEVPINRWKHLEQREQLMNSLSHCCVRFRTQKVWFLN